MVDPPASYEEFLERAKSRANASAPGDDGWISKVSKIAPILSGVAGLGGLIGSIVAARQSAQFREQLISDLQAIQSELAGIKNDLDEIIQELQHIEADIKSLRLDAKLDSIETWGSELAALVYDPTDPSGAQRLAAGMIYPSQPDTNLLGCMVGLHNALVGESIGTPLTQLLDAPGFLRIRARLNQGLQLLAFACAFNTAEEYDYNVFLLQWAANFEQEAALYFALNKEFIPEPGSGKYPILAGDCAVIYQYAQSTLPNVALTIDGTGKNMWAYTGTLGWEMLGPPLSFPNLVYLENSPNYPPQFACADMINNVVTTDPNSEVYRQAILMTDRNRYLVVSVMFGMDVYDYVHSNKVKLVCGARYDPAQTFLGAVNGQMAWVAETGQTTYQCSIHDGNSTAAKLLSYDATQGVSAIKLAEATTLSEVLWVVTWVSKDVVTISASQAGTALPAYLSLDGSGGWTVAQSPINLNVKAADATIGLMLTNPFNMPPTPATIASPAGSSRTVLFHQL
jgi:hypothetical protein